MVDLSTRPPTTGETKQRAFHLKDATHERLRRGAELASTTMSDLLDRMIWEDLVLPDDPVVNVNEPIEPPAPPTGRAAQIVERADGDFTEVGDVNQANEMNAKAMARLRKSGHFATKDDGSDQREKDPTNDGRGGDLDI